MGAHWLGQNYNVKDVPGWVWGPGEKWPYYYLYSLGRAAGTAGLRSVGGRDWSSEVAGALLARQQADGSWRHGGGEDGPVRTCFALGALVRARAPALINKLDGVSSAGSARRDAANFTRWFSRRYGRSFAWQRLSPADPQEAFDEAPILYIDGMEEVALPTSLSPKVRQYLQNGGTILVQLSRGDTKILDDLQKYFLELLPEYHAEVVGRDHPIFDLREKIAGEKHPKAVGIGDYCRTRIFILTTDVTTAWHANALAESVHAFQFGANLLFYTTNMTLPSAKLAHRRARPPSAKTLGTIRVARLKHAGDWGTCPQAMPRLNDVLSRAVSIGVAESQEPVDLQTDVPADVKLLWMTGSAPAKLSSVQRDRLKKYLESGGMIFIDPAVGRQSFFEAAREMLAAMFGAGQIRSMPPANPLLTGEFAGGVGSNVTRVSYTLAVKARNPRLGVPVLWYVEREGRIAAVLSRYGVTCPLAGPPTYGALALKSEDARRLAANVVLYAGSRR